MNETNNKPKQPTHRAFVVKPFIDKDGVEKGRWLEIGSVWQHGDSKGFDVKLEAVPVDGRVVIRLIEAKPANGDTPASATA